MTNNPFNSGEFYRTDELESVGFRHVGEGALVARNCTIVGLHNISIGKYSRIDAYSMIIATDLEVCIGRNVHIGCYSLLSGRGGIVMEDFSGLSSGVKIYTANDDYSGDYLSGPTLPDTYTNVTMAPVRLCRHAMVGASTIILPGVVLGEGASVGALSMVSRSLEPWTVNVGVPAKPIKLRESKQMMELERAYLAEHP